MSQRYSKQFWSHLDNYFERLIFSLPIMMVKGFFRHCRPFLVNVSSIPENLGGFLGFRMILCGPGGFFQAVPGILWFLETLGEDSRVICMWFSSGFLDDFFFLLNILFPDVFSLHLFFPFHGNFADNFVADGPSRGKIRWRKTWQQEPETEKER